MGYSDVNGKFGMEIGCDFINQVKINKFDKFHNIWTKNMEIMEKILFSYKKWAKKSKTP